MLQATRHAPLSTCSLQPMAAAEVGLLLKTLSYARTPLGYGSAAAARA